VEVGGLIRDEEPVPRVAVPLGERIGAHEHPPHFGGGLLRGIDEGHVRPERAADGWRQQGVVGAAEDQRVDPMAPERLQVLLRHRLADPAAQPPLLHQRDEERAVPREHRHRWVDPLDGGLIGSAQDGGAGADDPDALVPRGAHRRLRPGPDDADDRHLEVLAQRRQRPGGGGVAGDHDALHAEAQEELDVLQRELHDGRLRFRAVGHAGSVAEVDDGLRGQIVDQRLDDGEAADA